MGEQIPLLRHQRANFSPIFSNSRQEQNITKWQTECVLIAVLWESCARMPGYWALRGRH